MKVSIKSSINYIAVFTIFIDTLVLNSRVMYHFGELRLSYVLMPFILILMLPTLKGIYFNKYFLYLFSAIVVLSLYNVYIGKDNLSLLLKQVIGVFLSALVFYLLFSLNNYNVKELFRVYLNIALGVAIIGLFQELSYLLGFKAGYDFSYILPGWSLGGSGTGGRTTYFLRVTSILTEPAHFSTVMMPAFFASLTSFSKINFRFLGKWKSSLIILSFFFSFSSIGFLGIIFSLMLLAYNNRKWSYVIVSTIIITAFVLFTYSNIVEFRTRVNDSVSVLSREMELQEGNLSTFALFSNALVAYNSFKNNPFFGSGLGSHEISYDKYIGEIVKVDFEIVNREDANSFFLRLLSETGLFGLLIILVFIFKYYIQRKKDISNYLWIINNAILCMFFVRLVRTGHYFVLGFFFFFWAYYFSKVNLRGLQRQGGNIARL